MTCYCKIYCKSKNKIKNKETIIITVNSVTKTKYAHLFSRIIMFFVLTKTINNLRTHRTPANIFE